MQCRHHPRCPGCPLAGVAYPEQLERKRARLLRAFAHFPHLREPEPIVGAAWVEGYRHRLKLPVHVGEGRVSVGLYGARRRVLDTPDCPVLTPALRDVLGAVRDWLAGRKGVHSLDLRVSHATGEAQLILACRGGQLHGGPHAARALMRAVPALVSVAVSRADKQGKRVMGAKPRVIAGRASLSERIGGVRYSLHPGAFFQVDPRQAEVLHGLVREAVGDARSVLDLYAGVGAYGRMLAPHVERVVAVEEVPAAVRSARHEAPANLTVLQGRVEDVRVQGRFDVAILNPARRGSDPESLKRLVKRADRVVYVSCGPETLARDLDVLAAHGMRVERVIPVDLFPQTAEVETVVALRRGPALRSWRRGRVRGPWHGEASGASGRADEAIALVLGDVRPGRFGPAQVERIGRPAGHSLVKLTLAGPLRGALGALARRGHRVAGEDPKTRRFFAEKGGLVRPFVHVSRSGSVRAPLHGDLKLVLEALDG